MSEASVIEAAVAMFTDAENGKYEAIAELFMEKFEEKYKAWMTRVRLGVRTADLNSQILLDCLNSKLFYEGFDEYAYRSAYNSKHGLIQKSETEIKDRIEKLKEKKDNKRND